MPRQITPQTSLENLRKEAKRRLKELRATAPTTQTTLRDMQHTIAVEYGFPGWTELKKVLGYEQLAQDMVAAYASGDAAAMERINTHYGRATTPEDLRAMVWRLIYKVRRAKGSPEAFQIPEAQELIARTSGFENWEALTTAAATGAPPSIPAFSVDASENRMNTRRDNTSAEWDTLVAVMKERRLTTLTANGFMSDDALVRIAELDHVTSLDLSGSRGLTDDGLAHLASMPQLEHLTINEYPGGKLTDRGLEVLRHLPNLKTFRMNWQRGISDAGIAHLRHCEKLEEVDLMGSPTGDGAVEALRGKPQLRKLQTGRLVTDAGLAMLPEFPHFRHRHEAEETALLLDGPFTNSGFAVLKDLDGLRRLDLFWHVEGISSDAFALLPKMASLEGFGCDGELSDNEAMAYYAAIPRLKKLRAQKLPADDEGFVALSRSRTLEELWAHESPYLSGRGFKAMSGMPRLESLAVSCESVDDTSLASLAGFPTLRHFTAAGVGDDGFRHVGRCRTLDKLWCMYCRSTGDIATEHIADLHLKTYYAGLTQITDRSLEILGKMASLESIELYETKSVTDQGIAYLTALPNLRELKIFGVPNVSYAGTRRFNETVRVDFSV